MLWVGLAASNGAELLLMAADKCKARHDRWRVAEFTLLCGMVFGGVAGGWCGMLLCSHKIRKWSFLRWAVLASVCSAMWPALWLLWSW